MNEAAKQTSDGAEESIAVMVSGVWKITVSGEDNSGKCKQHYETLT